MTHTKCNGTFCSPLNVLQRLIKLLNIFISNLQKRCTERRITTTYTMFNKVKCQMLAVNNWATQSHNIERQIYNIISHRESAKIQRKCRIDRVSRKVKLIY